MPRPQRICIPGQPHHVVQRGNNRHVTFYHNDDYSAYLSFLDQALKKHEASLHAYVLMTNHVHLLLTPAAPDGLSLVMQTLGRRYVTYINKTYRRTGTLWEGRFKSSLVDSETYCLACHRYIELNPLRAGMVNELADYRWSSYHGNGLGQTDGLLTRHSVYLDLANTDAQRVSRYRELVDEGVSDDVASQIRLGVRKELPLGDERFLAEIEKHLGRRLGTGKVGRPARMKLDLTP